MSLKLSEDVKNHISGALNQTDEFILLTLLFAEKSPWNLVNLCTY